MKKIKIEQTLLAAALALGLALSAKAQDAAAMSSAAPPAAGATGYSGGLLGTNYSGVSFGYLKANTNPDVFHDYSFVTNETVVREGSLGLDANFTYDYVTGSAFGFRDYRSEVLFGATGYMEEAWGKPFITVDAGWARQQTTGSISNSLAYNFSGGVEIPIVTRLTLTPYLTYDAEPHLRDHDPAAAYLPNYTWDYGVMANYRLSSEWSVSLAAQLDQHSTSDLGLRVGAAFHF